MKKSIVTIVAFMLFALAGFAQGGERIYIREYLVVGAGAGLNSTVYISEGGKVSEISIEGSTVGSGARTKNLEAFANILEGYYKKGFKLIAVVNKTTVAPVLTEYILEKQ